MTNEEAMETAWRKLLRPELVGEHGDELHRIDNFETGWNAHAEHTAALRSAAEALVAEIDSVVAEVNQLLQARDFQTPRDYMNFEGTGYGTTTEQWMKSYRDHCLDQSMGNIRRLKSIHGLSDKLTVLKAALEQTK